MRNEDLAVNTRLLERIRTCIGEGIYRELTRGMGIFVCVCCPRVIWLVSVIFVQSKYCVSGMGLPLGEISAPGNWATGKFVYVSNVNTRQKHSSACHSNK